MTQPPPILAFVLMPFASEFDDIYRLGIKDTAELLGIRAERVDEQIYAEGILDRIYRQIEAADIIIADMSAQNPNVFYEVGYAHGREKLCLLMTKDASDIPFDLKHKRHIVYGHSIQKLKTDLAKDLEWAKSEVDNVRRSRVRITLKSISGSLEKSKWFATAKIAFTLDMHNDSELPSVEIEAIYFYSSGNWAISQNDTTCSTTDSDLSPYKYRHFLSTPITRLPRNGWAQLQFTAKRTVAKAFNGEELRDSYPITGTSVLRLVTNKGLFDYEIFVDTVADIFPFQHEPNNWKNWKGNGKGVRSEWRQLKRNPFESATWRRPMLPTQDAADASAGRNRHESRLDGGSLFSLLMQSADLLAQDRYVSAIPRRTLFSNFRGRIARHFKKVYKRIPGASPRIEVGFRGMVS